MQTILIIVSSVINIVLISIMMVIVLKRKNNNLNFDVDKVNSTLKTKRSELLHCKVNL